MDQLWTAAAWLLAAIGLVLALWALFWDRAKGRRRCPKCWYDLAGLPLRWTGASTSNRQAADLATEAEAEPAPTAAITATPTPAPPAAQGVCTCPECGHQPRTESRIYRTCRRWRWAAFGCLLALVGAGGAQWPTIRDRGPWSLAPLFVLERFLPSPDNERAWDPVASDWVMHPVAREMESRLDNGAFTRVNWSHVIRATGILKTRAKWPLNVPYAVSMDLPAWAGLAEIKLTPRVPKWRPATAGTLMWETCGNAAMWRMEHERFQELGTLQPGMTEIIFDVTVSTHEQRKGRWLSDRGPVISCATTLRVPVVPVATDDEALTPIADPELDRQILHSLRVSRSKGPTANPRVWTRVYANQPLAPYADELLEFGASLEVLKDGAVVEYEELNRSDGWRIPPRTKPWRDYYASLADMDLSALARAEPDRWRIRLTPAPHLALRNFDAKRYWNGSINVPVIDLVIASDVTNSHVDEETR